MDCVDPWDTEAKRRAKAAGDALLDVLWRVGLDVIDDVSLVGGCEHKQNAAINLGEISIEDAESVVRTLEKIARIVDEEQRRSERKLAKLQE